MKGRAYYSAEIPIFREQSLSEILGILAEQHHFALEQSQKHAWEQEIKILKDAFSIELKGKIFIEFYIPRMGKRADVVLLLRGGVLILEFKVGSKLYDKGALDQAHDYALDLKNFHLGSHKTHIVPIVIATNAPENPPQKPNWATDLVANPLSTNATGLQELIESLDKELHSNQVDQFFWETSGYQPTPTIVEAAQALYRSHNVDEISRSDAGAENLSVTCERISEIIRSSKAENKKSICFITGVPGSGKTLAGLNLATKREADQTTNAVFLSGNGPLVGVLREALARDKSAREGIPKTTALREVAAFIQNIHHFRDEALRSSTPPSDKVVIFDEAQRAWGAEQTSRFMHQKRGVSDFNQSEPDFLIEYMDRHDGWCVIICLVGGGQEINKGEAGIGEWLSAMQHRNHDWNIHLSERLQAGREYFFDERSHADLSEIVFYEESSLHLGVSLRSFRAETLSEFIAHVIENRPAEANRTLKAISSRYPILLTRNLGAAKTWVMAKSRGTERFGLIASSGAHRLRPEGVSINEKIDAPIWFLNSKDDVRSSYYLEEVATEFDVQGLELDWAIVGWDADFRYRNGLWTYSSFRGSSWQSINSELRKTYLKNAYRVILTRARQGMILFVPQGTAYDHTRPPSFYDQTYEYLKSCGIPELSN